MTPTLRASLADMKVLEKIGKRVVISMPIDAYQRMVAEVQQLDQSVSQPKTRTRSTKPPVEMGYLDVSELTKEQKMAWEQAKKAPLSSFVNL